MRKSILNFILICSIILLKTYGFGGTPLPCGNNKTDYEKALCYNDIANTYFENQQYSLAISNYKNAQSYFIKANKNIEAQNVNKHISIAHESNGELSYAIKFQEDYISFLETRTDTSVLIKAKERLADLKAANNSFDEAQQEISEVVKLEESRANKKGVVRSRAKYNYYSSQRSMDIESENKKPSPTRTPPVEDDDFSIDDLEEEELDEELIETYDALGDYYESAGEEVKALEYKSKAANAAKEIGRNDIAAQQNIDISNSLMESNRPQEAILKLEESVSLTEKKNDAASLEIKKKALEDLSKAYAETGDLEKAKNTLEKLAEAKDTIYRNRLKEIGLATEGLQAQQKFEIVSKEREVTASQYELQRKSLEFQKWITTLSLIALIISIIATIVIYRNAAQKRKANQLLALKSLRSQMNPHFIFNALNSVNGFISENDERSANKFLAQFSKLMRMVMEYSEQDFISLKQEIDILELYLKLEHYRFRDKFEYKFSIDKNIDPELFLIPPMLIQPYIENAVWHGLRYKTDSIGLLNVTFNLSETELRITITDNGIGRKKSEELKTKNQKEQRSTGMRNIESRLHILNDLYKTKISVNIIDSPNQVQGTKVEILIPKNLFKQSLANEA